jgi:RES domain-containing protein
VTRPQALGGSGVLRGWHMCQRIFEPSWNSGEGSYLFGGRWNSKGRRVIYGALDPAVAILEVAVHKGFQTLDTVPHTLVSFVVDPAHVHVVEAGEVPNPHWLHPCSPSAGQQRFGDQLLDAHPLVLIPSVVSPRSWNLLVNATTGLGWLSGVEMEPFGLDPRLHAPGH